MKEYQFKAEHGPELAISRWPDGKYSVKVFSSLGQQVAHLIFTWDMGSRLREAMYEMSDDVEASPSPSV